jgi:chemotaxis protein MotB
MQNVPFFIMNYLKVHYEYLLNIIYLYYNYTTYTDKETKILLPVDDLFSSGSATTQDTGKTWLVSLAKSLQGQRYSQIRVDGHSDSIPIRSSKYPSNWELSGARASDAVRILIKNGIPKGKIAAVGYADTKPIASNATVKGRAKNRRIEITIVAVDDGMIAQ